MLTLQVTADMDRDPWTDLDRNAVLHGMVERIGLLRAGTVDDRASIAVMVRLDDGRTVIGETTWRLFNMSARALATSPVACEESE